MHAFTSSLTMVTVFFDVTYFFSVILVPPKKLKIKNLQMNSRIRPCVKLIQFYRAMEQMAVSFRTQFSFVAWQSPAKPNQRP